MGPFGVDYFLFKSIWLWCERAMDVSLELINEKLDRLTNHFVVRCSMDFLLATNFSTWLNLAANTPRSGLGFCFCGYTTPVDSCNSEYQPR